MIAYNNITVQHVSHKTTGVFHSFTKTLKALTEKTDFISLIKINAWSFYIYSLSRPIIFYRDISDFL